MNEYGLSSTVMKPAQAVIYMSVRIAMPTIEGDEQARAGANKHVKEESKLTLVSKPPPTQRQPSPRTPPV